MADETLKRLLIKLKIDSSEWDSAVRGIKQQLDQLYAEEKAKAESRRAAGKQDEQLARQQAEMAKKVTEQMAAQAKLSRDRGTVTEKQLRSTLEELKNERSLLGVKQSQLKVMMSTGEISQQVYKTLEKDLVLERQKLDLLEKQARASAAQKESGPGWLFRDIFRGATSGMFGGGLLGGVAGGAFAGTLFGQGTYELAKMLAEKIKEIGKHLVEASGGAQTMRMEFEKLAEQRGSNPAKMLQSLRVATEGLTTDTELFTLATRVMRSGVKATDDQIFKLVGTTVKLAQQSNKSVPEALRALEHAFASGQFRTLAYATGLSQMDLRLRNLPQTLDVNTRKTLEFNHILEAEEKALKKIGDPVRTLPDLLRQLTVTQNNFVDGVVEGFLQTGKFGNTIHDLSQKLIDAQPRIMEIARTIGDNLAKAIQFITGHLPEIKLAVEALVDVKLAYWVKDVVLAFGSWKTAIIGVIEKLGLLKTAEAAAAESGVAVGAGAGAAGAGTAAGAGAATGGLLGMASTLAIVVSAVLVELGIGWLIDKMRNSGSKLGVVGSYGLAGLLGPAGLAASMAVDAGHASGVLRTGSAAGSVEGPSPIAFDKPGVGYAQALMQEMGALKPEGKGQPDVEWNVMVQRQQAALKEKQLLYQIDLEHRKAQIAEEMDAQKQAYDNGLIALKDYIKSQDDLNEQERRAKKAEVDASAKARIQEMKANQTQMIDGVPVPMRDAVVEATEERMVWEKAKDEKLKIDQEYDKKHRELVAKGHTDELAAQKLMLEQSQKIRQIYLQEDLKLQKASVEEQLKANEDAFSSGQVSAEAYLTKKKELINEERDLTLTGIAEEAKAAQQAADEKAAHAVQSEEVQTQLAKAAAEEQAKYKVQAIDVIIDAEKKLSQLQRDNDKIRLQALQNEYERTKALYANLQEAAQIGITTGQPGAAQAKVSALEGTKELNANYLAELSKQLELVDAGSQEWANILKAQTSVLAEQQKINDELFQMRDVAGHLGGLFGTIAQALGNGDKGAAGWLKRMSAIMAQLSEFSRQISALGGGKQALGGLWGDLKNVLHGGKDTVTATDPVEKFKQSVSKAADTTKDAGSALTKFGNGVVDTTAKYQKAMQDAITETRAFAKAAVDAINKINGGGDQQPQQPGDNQGVPDIPDASGLPAVGSDTTQGASDAASKLADFSSSLGKAIHLNTEFGAAFGALVDKVKGWIGAVGQVVQSIAGAKSTGGGILSGGMAGAQFGANFGPWGAAIGAVVGATFGGIVGAKQAEAQKDADKIKNELNQIIQEMNSGAITLGDAINQLRKERSAAVNMLGGDKKGGKQLPGVLQAIDAEISKLIDEQKQVLDNLHQELIILSEPTQFQTYLQGLDDIIKKYQEFVNAAAGSADEVANANLFLTDSLKQYTQTLSDDLNTAEQQAINDAIHLLDLQQQRLDLMNQEQTQEYDILTGDTLKYKRTTAQDKGQQIEAAQAQYNQQMDQINQEIALTSYKVQSEQQIFALAADRIGLETELLGLQEQQIDKSTAQTQALQQVLLAVQAAVASGNLPSGLNATGGLASGSDLLNQIAGILGLPPSNIPGTVSNAPDTQDFLGYIPPQYQSDAQLVQNIFPNFLHFLIEGLAQGNSQARSAAASQMGAVWNEIKAQDPNAKNFANWVNSGSLPANTPVPPGVVSPYTGQLPPYESGGLVDATKPALVHEGEVIIPADTVKSVMRGASGKGTSIANLAAQQFAMATGTGGDIVSSHQQVLNMAMKRVSLENALLSAQADNINADMNRIAMLSQVLDKMGQVNTSGSSGDALETALASLYQRRGRYGSGGFRREVL